jgi:hypothetical protein
LFARGYALVAPDGAIYEGRNIIEFVRKQSHLFAAADLEWRNGQCRAAKALSRLRPGVKDARPSWKGWTWHDAPAAAYEPRIRPDRDAARLYVQASRRRRQELLMAIDISTLRGENDA